MQLCDWVAMQPVTVEEIARRIGVHRVMLHKWMTGQHMPSARRQAFICIMTENAVTRDDMALSHSLYYESRQPLCSASCYTPSSRKATRGPLVR